MQKSGFTRAAILNAALEFIWSRPFREMTVTFVTRRNRRVKVTSPYPSVALLEGGNLGIYSRGVNYGHDSPGRSVVQGDSSGLNLRILLMLD